MAKDKPLEGLQILITRTPAQSSELKTALETLGAKGIVFPMIEIVSIPKIKEVLEEVRSNKYTDVIFTSQNAVKIFFENFSEPKEFLEELTLYVVGKKTQEVLHSFGPFTSYCPKTSVAEGLLEILPKDLKEHTFFLPRAKASRDLIIEEIEIRGGEVDPVTLYESKKPDPIPKLPEKVDAICFASSSAVKHFAEEFRDMREVPCFVYGPITRKTAENFGFSTILEASKPETSAVVDLISSFFTSA